MFTKRHFLRLYLILTIIFALLGALDGLFLLLGFLWPTYLLINSLLFFGFFLFNFLAVIEFHHSHDRKILYILPLYHILKYIGLVVLILTADESTILTLNAREYALVAIILGILELVVSLAIFVKVNINEPTHESIEHTHH